MAPIYLLNVDTGMIGSEGYLSVRDAWKWHVTRYCHPYRNLREVYVESSSWSDMGYVVSMYALAEYLTAPAPL